MQSTTRWCLNEGSMGTAPSCLGQYDPDSFNIRAVIYNTCGVAFRDPLPLNLKPATWNRSSEELPMMGSYR
jgi:hypothetical protein